MNYSKLFLILFLLASLLFWSGCEREQPLDSEKSETGDIQLNRAADGDFGPVENQYIVVLKKGANSSEVARAHNVNAYAKFTHALNGFAAYITNENALNGLQNNPKVDYIEKDIRMTAFAQTTPTGVDRIDAESGGGGSAVDATAVDVAIIDSGIDKDHPDLNVVNGRHFWTETKGPPPQRGPKEDDNYDDDNGHGTHVGGTVGAYDNSEGVVGVAPGVRLWAVKVLDKDGSGYMSDIIRGVDYVTANASDIEVANMSLGGVGSSSALRTAIQNSVNAGVVYIVAAGNDGRDVFGSDGVFGTSDDIIPAAYPEAAAISAFVDTDGSPGGNGTSSSYGTDDSFASFSNFANSQVASNPVTSPGKAIDLLLPGVEINSTYLNGGYTTMSGTSMASPHGAGLAANYIAANSRASDATGVYNIRQALIDNAIDQLSSNGLVTNNDPDGNNEKIGWAGATGPQPPVADAGNDVTASDSDGSGDESVTLDGSSSYDPDGGTLTYEWTYNGSVIGNSSSLTHTFSVSSTAHTVTLKVTDDENETDTDTDDVLVTVNANQSPTADAGGDQSVTDSDDNGSETVTLNGSGSTDDGTISSYDWYIDGNSIGSGETLDHTFNVGSYTVELVVTDNAGATGNDFVNITVNQPSTQISVTGISPSSGDEGTTVDVTISGTGFVSGASVALENGSGPSPDISNVTVVDGNTITATFNIKSGGPPRNRDWDVRVTNPDNTTDVLSAGFTVIAQ